MEDRPVFAARFELLGHAPGGRDVAWDRDGAREVWLMRGLGAAASRAAGLASRADHPAWVRVIGVWSDRDEPVLVLEPARGVPLSTLGPLSEAHAVAVVRAVAGAVAAARQAGVAHTDLRPELVLVELPGDDRPEDEPVVRIIGLGAGEAVVPGLTAPEGPSDGVAGSADVYGLGVVAFRALVGRMPFAAATPWAALTAQRAGVVVPTGVRPDLAALIERLLAVDPGGSPGPRRRSAGPLGALWRGGARAPLAGAGQARSRVADPRAAPRRRHEGAVGRGSFVSHGAHTMDGAAKARRRRRARPGRSRSE